MINIIKAKQLHSIIDWKITITNIPAIMFLLEKITNLT